MIKENVPIDKMDYFEIIAQLIGIFQIVHDSGYTYNDLKLANIMLNISEDY